MILGVDTGGTFTDFVLVQDGRVRIHKVLSTPEAPEQAILQGIEELGLGPAVASGSLRLVHGTTVATNAALEGKGARTLYLANAGLEDVLTIGRQARRELYNLTPTPQAPPVPPELCLGVACRLDAQGHEIDPLTETEIQAIVRQVMALKPEAVAINLLFSFLDDTHEKQLQAALPPDLFVSRSSAVLPEYKEYERGMATWLNAWLGPVVSRYLTRLRQALAGAPLSIMQSSGGTLDVANAASRAVNLLLSGPAGGLAAARFLARQTGLPRLLTFDMGGTSTDVALLDGEIRLTSEGHIGPYPVAVPMVDLHTIGAGGGSLAWLDAGGMLQVGPQSAGARPGPACYGRGGTLPTVTDANLLLGRLQPDAFLGGAMTLDLEAARQALAPLAQTLGISVEAAAAGVIRVANEHMARALRFISIQRGFNPADFVLCCFGGAGGVHVCALAESLGMSRALIPTHGGVLSALGMLVAPRERQLSRTFTGLLGQLEEADLRAAFQALEDQARTELRGEGREEAEIAVEWRLEARYRGQSFTLGLPFIDLSGLAEQFHQAHQRQYGHRLALPVEVVTLRVAARAPGWPVEFAPFQAQSADAPELRRLPDLAEPVPMRPRATLVPGESYPGPLLISETISTSLVAPGWQVSPDRWGHLHLQRDAGPVDH